MLNAIEKWCVIFAVQYIFFQILTDINSLVTGEILYLNFVKKIKSKTFLNVRLKMPIHPQIHGILTMRPNIGPLYLY